MTKSKISLVPAKGNAEKLKKAIDASVFDNSLERFLRMEYETQASTSSSGSLHETASPIQRITLSFADRVTITTRMKFLQDLLGQGLEFTIDLSEAGACLDELIEELALNEEVVIRGNGSVFEIAPYRRITFSNSAKFTFNDLLPEDRRDVKASIDPFEDFPHNDLNHQVKKLLRDGLYMAKAGNFRVMFQVDDDGIEVEAIMNKNLYAKIYNCDW